ncbi:ribose-5-phosphate isomerase RpiA [Lachnospiraceae bacterium ASD3451]|nr:ribose-5-phosphate isomerase RpiA [Diplocloster agilis]
MQQEQKQAAALKAAEYIRDNMILGLGTGSTAYYLIRRAGELVKEGMRLKAVATSRSSEKLAEEFGIPVTDINEVPRIDLTIDGVDEIDPDFEAVKGGGGALTREKITAYHSKQVIWIMDHRKQVLKLGAFPLPVEVLPFGWRFLSEKIQSLGYTPILRIENGQAYRTDNGNYILDIHSPSPAGYRKLSGLLRSYPGVVETGYFPAVCSRIIVADSAGVRVFENKKRIVSGDL